MESGDNMAELFCKKCGSNKLFLKPNGTQIGAFCSKCGAWVKWASKADQEKINWDIQLSRRMDISQLSNDELIEELRRRLLI